MRTLSEKNFLTKTYQTTFNFSSLFPEQVRLFPQLRYMGSKYRLLPWIHEILSKLEFSNALDAFAGSCCVAYLMKAMEKRVITNDFLSFSYNIALATIENSKCQLTPKDCETLLSYNPKHCRFIERTFSGIFFTPSDLRFLDNVWSNIYLLTTQYHKSLAISALIRACIKRQPRGVFTVAGDPERYKDGRRDLTMSLKEHFLESVKRYNQVIFDNKKQNKANKSDVFKLDEDGIDLVYFDPPYVPRADDNCYIKRYHFLEGLASYWKEEGANIMGSTKVKKIPKKYTPFSYRSKALEAFDGMFNKYRKSIYVLSYSSNGFPDLKVLINMMKKYKRDVEVFEKNHRYHFGTHKRVSGDRTSVQEYLVVGI